MAAPASASASDLSLGGSTRTEFQHQAPGEMEMKAKLGIAPIAWWNDDLAELSDDVSLEECLRQASVAGFTGMETGRRFPMRHDGTRADSRALRNQRLRRLVLRAAARRRHRAREGSHPRPDGFLHRGQGALHRLWRDGALHPGRPLGAAFHEAEALRGRDQGLRPQDDGVCGMVRRPGHADLLPSPYGRRRSRPSPRSIS